jgi:hypothetical protein
VFVFSFIWSFGAAVPVSFRSNVSQFVRDHFTYTRFGFPNHIDENSSVFDYFLDVGWLERNSFREQTLSIPNNLNKKNLIIINNSPLI